jgi:hypothetical protein
MNKAQIQRPITSARVIEFPRVEESTQLEIDIETRLAELKDFAEGFGDDAFSFFLAETISVREAIEELVVKVNALDWIARVAKRSTGCVRERLWADIDNALSELEKTAESLVRAEEEWAHSDSGGRRERVVCVDRF